MKIAIIMLIAGLSIGSAATTLLWSGPISRGHARVEKALAVADEWKAIATKNQNGWNDCLAKMR